MIFPSFAPTLLTKRSIGHAVATLQGNFSQAWTLLNDALPLQREHSEPNLLNITLVYLGTLALLQGDMPQSLTFLREGLLFAQRTGNRYMLAIDLITFGCVLGTLREPSMPPAYAVPPKTL
jgi:hypothetical protein